MGNKTNLKTYLVMAVILLGFSCTIAAGEVIYVDADASAGGNGTSWGTAYKYLQDALYKPPSGGDQIWVAEGTYKPDEDEGGNVTPSSRTATFQLITGVAIYGGIGGGESILSGDIGTAGDSSDNSYHVVTGSGTGETAVLDGFTITAGNANGSHPDNRGGGMYNDSGSPTVTNCTFSGNEADWAGGMFNDGSGPMLANCTFSENRAAYSAGGMYNNHSSPTVTNCTFSGNSSSSNGGGMSNSQSSNPMLTNCTFSGNSAKYGGGMQIYTSSPTLTNCTFSRNSAGDRGGGIFNGYGSNPTLVNCTFSANSAVSKGGGIYSAGPDPWPSNPTVTNCILWGDTPEEIYVASGTPLITYTDVQGGWSGTGNIPDDPLFADADLRLSAGSPCIDAGDNTAVPVGVTTDLDGNPRIVGPAVDMGAYESQGPSNRPPVANAGLDQTVERESHEGTQITLDGSGSSDPDGDPLTYEWTWDGGSASGVSPTIVLPLGTTSITLVVNDGTVNSDPDTVDITVEDTTPPQIEITFPTADLALQDIVTLTAVADDWSGVSDVYFYVREPDGGDGIPIGCEDLPSAWNGTTELWEFDFDTTGLLDGYYVILATAEDTQGNEGWSKVIPFSIRNWAVLELLPASKSNKAGRTMPVKFSLRIAESVDAMMPFVYNEELEITIYDAADPGTILQTSLYGDTSKDYRINILDELYITNFKTKKQPAEYVVEIWRLSKDFLVESFTFETVK